MADYDGNMTNQNFLTEKDIDYLEKRLKDIFPTREEFKELKSDLFDKLDEILKEIQTSREERIIKSHQISRHEDKIAVLEEIHPHGKHASL